MMHSSILKGWVGRGVVLAAFLVGVMALLLSGLTASDVSVHAQGPNDNAPAFTGTDFSREIAENTPPGVNIEAPISATDLDEDILEFGDTLTYSLGGTDAASFDIDESTGQLITKTPLDRESKTAYSVMVTVKDSGDAQDRNGQSRIISQEVQISVTEVDEPPLALAAPTVVSGEDDDDTDANESTTSLKIVWHPPEKAGRPDATSYAVQYKKSTDTSFIDDDQSVTGTNTTITLTGDDTADTSYDVRVRATNAEGNSSPWSLVGTGSTNKEGNSAPSFNETDSLVELDVNENTPAGEDIDSPVTATDADTTTLTYDIEGPHADLFSFDTRSGQIRTKAPLNHEDARCGYVDGATPSTSCIYRVTVTVVDRAGGSDATGVHIEVDDRDEPPSAPARPTVRATEKSSTTLEVSWNAPENTGPPITSYDVQYRKGTETFSADGVTVAGTTATISGIGDHDSNPATDDVPWLSPNTSYEVRVRATNDERTGEWSATGTGRTNRANHQPIFDERPLTDDPDTAGVNESERNTAFTVSRRIDENPRSGQTVGGRVFADDEDNDSLTYRLVASADTDAARTEAAKFDIDERTGQIRTKAGMIYNYEDITASNTCNPLTDAAQIGSDRCYTVKVEVWDGLDDDKNAQDTTTITNSIIDDSITVKIAVRDRDEPPAVPTVTVTAPTGNTTLEVFWDAKNTGPDITEYDLQYRKGGGTFLNDNCLNTDEDDNCDDIAPGTTNTTIIELVEDTSYSVQVRATNDEGVSAWSRVVTVKTNKGTNDPPTFNPITLPLEVDEKTPSGRNVDTPVSAEDTISTSLTYRLEGRDAALFTINSSTGQIRTRSALNHEETYDCKPGDGSIDNCYLVRVRVDDGAGGSVSREVTITVNDVDEPPSAPSAPRVTATKDTGWSLDVSWNEPRDTGGPPITDYDIQYRKYKAGTPKEEWQLWPHGTASDSAADNTDRSAQITRRLPGDTEKPLEPSTQYEVRVRAKNGEGDTTENWSSVGRGTTGPSNSRPSFDRPDAVIELRVDEDTRSGQNVGSAVSASDTDSNTLRYSLEGPGKDSFTIVSSSGQVRTKSPLDFETRQSYSVTVKVDDGQKRKNSVAAKSVKITVDNVAEIPSAPAPPRVVGIPGSTDSVRVTWDASVNTGPAVTAYEVHYRESGSGLGYRRWAHSGADRSTVITDLKAGTRYEVQVRARSAEGTSEWSRSGTGMPNPDVENRNPTFSGGSRSLSVVENTPPNTDVGAPVAATDRDGDTLTYILEGTDADSFDIVSTSDGGQIRTNAPLNYEEKSSYSVTVRVTDGRGGTDAANVTIRVTDVNTEAPDTPFAPTVMAISSTRLQVTWEAPANTGPPITDYDYRYREPGGSWTEVTNTTISATAATIEGLAASTSYDVEVRAKNAEGTSDWSDPGIGSTNAPGANNPPVFSDGGSATRSVSANSPAGGSIGDPVTATDADSDDTLTYNLEGRDAALFDIDTASGQLRTKSGVTLIAAETYTVIVVADDGADRTRITVSIEATAAPPNNPPVFAEGTSVTRSVTIDARAGTNIGQPFRATDADTGDTVTYSLEGTDAASFGINGSTGQMRTKAGVTLESKTYNVTVKAADQKGANSILAVTIEIDDRDGSVSLSPSRPQFSDRVTAVLSDPDGGVTGVTWTWALSSDGTSGWTPVLGATSSDTSSTLTIAASYVGSYLRATASYTDAVGSGKSANAVTAAVSEDDDGTVTLSTRTPEVGSAIRATLTDPDGGVTGETWQWAKSNNGSTGWTDIQGATSASYTPGRSDAGAFLRATVSYDDAVGTGKSAQAATSSGVAQMELLSEYDANRNESIERSEAIRAVSDYFDGEISKDDVLAVLVLYFSG